MSTFYKAKEGMRCYVSPFLSPSALKTVLVWSFFDSYFPLSLAFSTDVIIDLRFWETVQSGQNRRRQCEHLLVNPRGFYMIVCISGLLLEGTILHLLFFSVSIASSSSLVICCYWLHSNICSLPSSFYSFHFLTNYVNPLEKWIS